jgi:protein-tyrosine-phosphatase
MKLLLIISLMALSTIPGNGQTKKVVFVCEHGAGKSVVAAAYFNKIAKDRNLDWEASCRGTDPDEEVSSLTKEGLRADNLLDPTLSPKKLAPGDTSNVEKIILFTKLPDDSTPALKVKTGRLYLTSMPNTKCAETRSSKK